MAEHLLINRPVGGGACQACDNRGTSCRPRVPTRRYVIFHSFPLGPGDRKVAADAGIGGPDLQCLPKIDDGLGNLSAAGEHVPKVVVDRIVIGLDRERPLMRPFRWG